MVPIPTNGTWHEEQIDELFASLLGRGFEGAAFEDMDSRKEAESENTTMDYVELMNGDHGLGGLRVF